MTSLSRETVSKLGLVQELLKGMYEHNEKRADEAREEWKHPQDEKEANATLLRIGYAKGGMDAILHISKFINELVDADALKYDKKEKKKNKKYMDIKVGKAFKGDDKKGIKEISVDEIPDEDKAKMLYALAEAFGLIDEEEKED